MPIFPAPTLFNDAPQVCCGNRKAHRSGNVEWHFGGPLAVKECYGQVTLCRTQFDAGRDEDGEAIIAECFGEVTDTERGWTCTHGHEYVAADVRWAEGWDYASDEEEATQLRKYGTDAVLV